MRRILVALSLVVTLVVVAGEPGADAADPLIATPVVQGLAYPSMFTVGSDGRIFWTELQTGNIGVFRPDTNTKTIYATVPDLCTAADQGLFGVALHHLYPGESTVFAYATRLVAGVCHNQVIRLKPGQPLAVLASEPYTGEHIGGRIMIGPDTKLWVSTGEGGSAANAQDPATTKGKILRMNRDGTVPSDNPTPGSLVYAHGFRNVFGFDFDPATGRLWATENGPNCNDEINLVLPGGNYGWGPAAICEGLAPGNTNADGTAVQLPKFWYSPSDGPTGAAFCSGCGIASLEGKLLYGGWQYGDLRALTLDSTRQSITEQVLAFRHAKVEAPLSLETGPDGAVYFSDKTAIYRLGGSAPPPPTTTTTTRPTTTTTRPTTTTTRPPTTTTTLPPKISVSDASAVEGNSGTPTLVFTITLSRSASNSVSVNYATQAGTAGATDFVATSGTRTIPAGARSATVAVTIKPDLIREGTEAMTLRLSAPVRATIADYQGLGYIYNDD
ncbi:MAG: hypothetical protein QOG87_1261 [Actinomycetota bacterium]|jgi:glucose/arabinose dehydrogenase